MKALSWFIVNGIFLACIYYGFVGGVVGAKNVSMTFAWFAIVFSFFTLSEITIKDMKDKSPSVPLWLDLVFDLVVTACFAWFGAFVTSALYLFHTVLLQEFWRRIIKERGDE